MAQREKGGYADGQGWTGKPKDIPTLVGRALGVEKQPKQQRSDDSDGGPTTRQATVSPETGPDSDSDDPEARGGWETLAQHTDAVVRELEALIVAFQDAPGLQTDSATGGGVWETLRLAARWHDFGKAHDVFQHTIADRDSVNSGTLWAKFPKRTTPPRMGFRHELASALAMLEHGLPDLAAYLVATHHGKVRLSIRSLPHEKPPPLATRRFARGVWDGDILPEADLGGGVHAPETPRRLERWGQTRPRGPLG